MKPLKRLITLSIATIALFATGCAGRPYLYNESRHEQSKAALEAFNKLDATGSVFDIMQANVTTFHQLELQEIDAMVEGLAVAYAIANLVSHPT